MRSLDASWERAKILRDWRRYITRLASAIKEVLGDDVRIYIFGSAAKERLTAVSDIDVLIISKNIPKSFMERVALKLRIIDLSSLPDNNPFELHLVNDKEAKLYFHHIKDDCVRVA